MSKKLLLKWECIGFVLVSIVGTLDHFVYEWTSYNYFAALFCPVNESPWEHLKLIWFPYIVFAVFEYFILKKPNSFYKAKVIGGVVGMAATTTFFYTYSGILGKNIMWLDILSFFIGVFFAFFVDYIIILKNKEASRMETIISISAIVAITLIFFVFTFNPPLIPWFRDGKTLTYGV